MFLLFVVFIKLRIQITQKTEIVMAELDTSRNHIKVDFKVQVNRLIDLRGFYLTLYETDKLVFLSALHLYLLSSPAFSDNTGRADEVDALYNNPCSFLPFLSVPRVNHFTSASSVNSFLHTSFCLLNLLTITQLHQ